MSGPRASGDEPLTMVVPATLNMWSPRERG